MIIPNEICNTIQRQMNGFWWGSGADGQGVRWMAWDKLCTIKEAGGLGFKSLQQFNVAMLAKQGWRLVNEENPLVTSIMKARYFPNTDFLGAKLGENPSYMWRSIIAAQEVVKQGCRRCIGTGMDTFVWQIPWLPCVEDGFISTSIPNDFPNIKVCDLVNARDNSWDENILNNLFNERDIRLIKQIPLASTDRRDTWMWLFDTKGEFTVKSCYRQLVGECSTPDATFWKKLWHLELPGKVRFFVWRTCRKCLPTAMALFEKRVDIDRRCSWCRVEQEDAKHALFDCSFARNVWTAAGLANWVQTLQGESIMEHFKRLFATGTKEQCASLALFCWSIWNRRNQWVWNRVETSVFGTTSAAVNLLTDWKAAQMACTRASATINGSTRRWQVPMQSWVKINVDAAIFGDTKTIGVGGVIRDEHGSFLRAMCKQMSGTWTPREAEALSLKEVLSWVKSFGFARCVIETDSKLLADAYNGTPGRSYFHSIVNDCVDLVKHFESVLVRFVHRSANEVAHLLARVSRSMSGLQEWEEVVPNFLSDVITFDLI